jgi:type IV pilus assembly protein PilQ
MRMALRRPATAIVALMLAAALGCAARGPSANPRQAGQEATAPRAVSPESAAAPRAAARVSQAAFNEDSDGARVVLSADAPLLYTVYEPRPDLLVVDLPGADLSAGFDAPSAAGSLVSAIRVEPVVEMGKRVTRVSVVHQAGLRSDVRSVGRGLAISFEPPAPAEPEKAERAEKTEKAEKTAEAASEATPQPAADVPPAAPAEAPVVAEEIARPAPPRGELAHQLEEVRVSGESDREVTVAVLGDGVLQPRDFLLENPPRLVIDLPGVKNQVRRRVLPVKSALVTRVRVSQFQSVPEPVTRIVLDLARPLPHALIANGERLAIVVRAGEIAETPDNPRLSPPSETRIAQPVPAPSVSVSAPPPEEKSAQKEVRPQEARPKMPAPPPVPAASTAVDAAQMPAQAGPAPSGEPAKAAPPEPVPSAGRSLETGSAPPAREASAPAPAPPAASLQPAAVPESSAKLPPGVRKAQKGSAAASGSSARSSRDRGTPREEAVFEAAAAMLAQEEGARPEPSQAYQPRAITESTSQFTGEPLSLDLKDADIKDVFRTISQLTQLNIVVDPEVKGTVTVQLEDVPWDQALDLILKQNGLGYVLENNIMRIATTAKLQAEQADRSRLTDARQAAEPTRTVIKKLSYAKAGELTATIKSVMSRRGDIVVDNRTNTLIIREIPTYLPAVLQLIENLDTATQQVMIEARIVETTKTLGRSLGIQWGANGAADVAHGNTTNLSFPNNITGTFSVPLGTPQTVASVRLGNILDTFNLDIALSAAENQGLLKIISSPKVAALTNTAASIQSGVQIPVQTTVNNTTTVIYVDATLKLTVTPQITNEGTVILTVNVSKREPAVALNLSVGQNVPLTVREYKGEILVRDGGTSVIGGIFQINDQDQNNMIPGLWKIPILGNLFRNKTRTEKHDELLIFITPRILKQ